MKHLSFRSDFQITSMAAAVLLLASCGGGSGDGPIGAFGTSAPATSTPVAATPVGTLPAPVATQADTAAPIAAASTATGSTAGTVTGFGSVIVDGKRIDDNAATPQAEADDGLLKNVELKLGHHVEVLHDDKLIASRILIAPEVRGPVSAVDLAAQTFTVLGQTVKINALAASGPVTIFEAPYARLADIRNGDMIEVHALIQRDGSDGATLQATRIEQHAPGALGMVKGIVSELSTSGKAFKVGGLRVSLDDAPVTPARSALENGAEVVVRVPANASGAVATASAVRVKDRKAAMSGHDVSLAGPIGQVDTARKTFVVDGVSVTADKAVLESGQKLDNLVAGQYVRVKGVLEGGILSAATVALPANEQEPGGEAELHGSITAFASNAIFKVRGIRVDASNAKIICQAPALLSENLQVGVKGHPLSSGMVIAAEVKCEAAVDDKSVVGRVGQVAKLDVDKQTLTLGSGPTALTVTWTDGTVFVGLDASTLRDKKLEVEGKLRGSVLTATKIKREDS